MDVMGYMKGNTPFCFCLSLVEPVTHTSLKRDGGKERQKYLSTKTNGY